jgi:hypothetical protein
VINSELPLCTFLTTVGNKQEWAVTKGKATLARVRKVAPQQGSGD